MRFFAILSLGLLGLLFMWLDNTQAQPAQAGSDRTQNYIDRYKDKAISEMKEAGIPASIKLAQGILESGSGTSRLATKGNNHFGIKCQRDEWQGETMRHDDDKPDECFRVYDDPTESWEDHTEFLTSGWRYRELFELDPLDYEAWAHGLKEAGYATNPQYAELLIDIIENHELYVYDRKAASQDPMIAEDFDDPQERVFEFNGIEAVEVQEGETYRDITEEFLHFDYQLARYNDIEQRAELEEGTVLYLKPKNWRPSERYHTVNEGESMQEISQMYGVRLSRLYKRNLMDPEIEEEPVAGEKLYLRGRRTSKPETRLNTDQLKEETGQLIQDRAPTASDDRLKEYVHVVTEGEDLTEITSKFEVSKEDLEEWNRIPSDGVYKGDLIYLYLPEEQMPKPATGKPVTN